MKARFRIIVVLVGLTVAVITAGVPPVKKVGDEPVKPNACYAETDVQALMVLNHCSRAEAVAVLNLACEYAIMK
ncbi:MAG: hypothetical protein HRU69_13420 [Flammeovirgaceae bacterium]|nr:MAG: hypothetical protein HRU69_13420 [Flammeovirgaceae bacterium]